MFSLVTVMRGFSCVVSLIHAPVPSTLLQPTSHSSASKNEALSSYTSLWSLWSAAKYCQDSWSTLISSKSLHSGNLHVPPSWEQSTSSLPVCPCHHYSVQCILAMGLCLISIHPSDPNQEPPFPLSFQPGQALFWPEISNKWCYLAISHLSQNAIIISIWILSPSLHQTLKMMGKQHLVDF